MTAVKCYCGYVWPEADYDEFPQCPFCHGHSVEVIEVNGICFLPVLRTP